MSKWRPIETAPRDETPILIYTTCHGVVEAWYHAGSWNQHHESPEYDGAVWVCADDAFQIEVEETTPPCDGTATHWMPLPDPPDVAKKDIIR